MNTNDEQSKTENIIIDNIDIEKLKQEHIQFVNEIMKIKDPFNYDKIDSNLIKKYKEITKYDINIKEFLPKFYNYNESKEILANKNEKIDCKSHYPYLTDSGSLSILLSHKKRINNHGSGHSTELHELDRNMDEDEIDEHNDNYNDSKGHMKNKDKYVKKEKSKNLDELLKENYDDDIDENFLNDLNIETKGENLENLLGKFDEN